MGITGQDQVRLSFNASFSSLPPRFPLCTHFGPSPPPTHSDLHHALPPPPIPKRQTPNSERKCLTPAHRTDPRIPDPKPRHGTRQSRVRHVQTPSPSTTEGAVPDRGWLGRWVFHSVFIWPFFLVFGFARFWVPGDGGEPEPEPEWFGEARVVKLFGCAWYCVVLRGYEGGVCVREKRGERRRPRRLSIAGLPPPVWVWSKIRDDILYDQRGYDTPTRRDVVSRTAPSRVEWVGVIV